MTAPQKPRSFWSRPLPAAVALSGFALFIAAPTPGNVGGCGGSAASTPIQLCTRLIQCRSLCTALSRPPEGCDDSTIYSPERAPDLAEAFRRCVRDRGGLRDFVEQGNASSPAVFGIDTCPHLCPRGMRPGYNLTQWDVQTCGDAVLNLSCEQLNTSGTVFGAFTNAPPECLSACQ